MLIATADIALLILIISALFIFTGFGLWIKSLPGKIFNFIKSFFKERNINKEILKQEELKSKILEEQLRNEQLSSLFSNIKKEKK